MLSHQRDVLSLCILKFILNRFVYVSSHSLVGFTDLQYVNDSFNVTCKAEVGSNGNSDLNYVGVKEQNSN